MRTLVKLLNKENLKHLFYKYVLILNEQKKIK